MASEMSFVAERNMLDGELAEMIAAGDAQKPADTIDLAIGDPDLATDQRIIDAAFADASCGFTHYASPYGDSELLAAIRRVWQEDYDVEVARDEVMVTASATHAMYLLLDTVVDPGDEVVLFSPYFTPYKAQVQHAGGVPVVIECDPDAGFRLSAQALEAAVTSRTKAVIVNTPNNPTGVCLSLEELQGLVDVCRAHHMLLIADEIYTSFSFMRPFAPALWCEGAQEVCATIRSFSKDYCMSGWRLGYVIAPADVIEAMRCINESQVYTAPTLSQRAAIRALELRQDIRERVHEIYGDRLRFGMRRACQLPGVSVPTTQGSLYLFLDVRGTGMDGAQFCSLMKDEAHVLMLSGASFGAAGTGFVRLALRVDIPQLGQAFDRMERVLAAHSAAPVVMFNESQSVSA